MSLLARVILCAHRQTAFGDNRCQSCRSTRDFFSCAISFAGLRPFWTSLGTIQDRMAPIEPERIFKIVEPRAGRFISAVLHPAVGLQQCGRSQISIRIPPIAWARRRATSAQDAFVHAVEFGAVMVTLFPLLLGSRAWSSAAMARSSVLGVEILQIRHQVFHHRLMWQRIDFHGCACIVGRLGARQCVGAVDIHGA